MSTALSYWMTGASLNRGHDDLMACDGIYVRLARLGPAESTISGNSIAGQ